MRKKPHDNTEPMNNPPTQRTTAATDPNKQLRQPNTPHHEKKDAPNNDATPHPRPRKSTTRSDTNAASRGQSPHGMTRHQARPGTHSTHGPSKAEHTSEQEKIDLNSKVPRQAKLPTITPLGPMQRSATPIPRALAPQPRHENSSSNQRTDLQNHATRTQPEAKIGEHMQRQCVHNHQTPQLKQPTSSRHARHTQTKAGEAAKHEAPRQPDRQTFAPHTIPTGQEENTQHDRQTNRTTPATARRVTPPKCQNQERPKHDRIQPRKQASAPPKPPPACKTRGREAEPPLKQRAAEAGATGHNTNANNTEETRASSSSMNQTRSSHPN
ncbi:hypothetical protein [Paraburkholderia phenazinium]|uniref:hypothetical protein n=1 Tax=Paraburkholderia phenazinium TaxID=60549 RepID=UPI0015A10FC9|nr:hypothetical protein [Paraburkholderia phenazinium]